MPRRARITLAGVPLHLIQRGNNRQACFYCDDDCIHISTGWATTRATRAAASTPAC